MIAPEVRASQPRSIVANFMFLVVGHGLYKLTALVGLSLLAHYLNSAEFGRFTIALAATQLFEVFTDAGIGQAMVRDAAGHTERLRGYLAAALPLRFVLAAVNVGLAVLLIVTTQNDPQLRELALWIGISQGVSSFAVLLRATFQASERMEFVAFSVTMEGVVRLGAIIAGLVGVMGLVGIAKALVVAEVIVVAATATVVVHRFVPLARVPFNGRRTFEVFLSGLPFALAWLLLSADQRINTLLLGRLSGETNVAMFGAASRMMEVTLIVPSMLATAFFPAAVRHERDKLESLAAVLTASLKVMISIGIPIAIGLAVLATPLVTTIFGSDYAPAATPLRLLAAAALLLFARVGLIQVALVLGRWRLAIGVQIFGIAGDVLLALALIPAGGEQAAAIALVVSEVLTVGAALYALHSRFGRNGVVELGRPLVAGVAAGGLGMACTGISPVLGLVVAGVALLVGLRVVPVFNAQELAYVKSASPFLASLIAFAVRDRT